MRPEFTSRLVLSNTQATAKLREFRVAADDGIAARDPTALFSIAVGILGDVAATIARQPAGGFQLLLPEPGRRPICGDHTELVEIRGRDPRIRRCRHRAGTILSGRRSLST